MELQHDVDCCDNSYVSSDQNPNLHVSLLSHKMVTAWCSTSSLLAGQPTGTHLSPSAPSCSWSGDWLSGRNNMTEETGGLWYTACKYSHTDTCRHK